MLTMHEKEQNMTIAQNVQHDDRIAWWREAKFGMFIHWGLYAIPAGDLAFGDKL